MDYFEISINALKLDPYKDIDEVKVHHFIIRKMYLKGEAETKATLTEIAEGTNLTIKRVRRIVEKLEDIQILQVVKGVGKSPNSYRIFGK